MIKSESYLIIICRALLGILFIYASYDKILDPGKFARDINNYHIVPFGLENTVAIILPWLELLIGIGLIIGVCIDGASIISGGLLFVFIVLILQAILRGYDIECGCGLKEGQMVGWNKILENIILMGASALVYYRQKKLFEIFPKTALSE